MPNRPSLLQIQADLRSLLARRYPRHQNQITNNSKLNSIIQNDSVGYVELGLGLENDFDLPEESTEKLSDLILNPDTTIADLAHVIWLNQNP